MASLTSADGTTWYGPNPATERGEGTFISSNKAGTKIVYCAGNVVIVRDVADPSICEVYREHKTRTTVAKFSPSGNYIASGDASGKVRVGVRSSRKLRKRKSPFCGEVFDLEWGPESKRLVVCGNNGSNTNTKAYLAMTGSSQGELSGMQKGAHVRDEAHEALPRRVCRRGVQGVLLRRSPFKFNKATARTPTLFSACATPNGEYFVSYPTTRKSCCTKAEGDIVGELPAPRSTGLHWCLVVGGLERSSRARRTKQSSCGMESKMRGHHERERKANGARYASGMHVRGRPNHQLEPLGRPQLPRSSVPQRAHSRSPSARISRARHGRRFVCVKRHRVHRRRRRRRCRVG